VRTGLALLRPSLPGLPLICRNIEARATFAERQNCRLPDQSCLTSQFNFLLKSVPSWIQDCLSRQESGKIDLACLYKVRPTVSVLHLQAHRAHTEADQARSDSLETRRRRRRTDPGLEAVSSTAPKLHTRSRTTRNVLNEDQMATRESGIATSVVRRVSGTSRTQSTSNSEREARQQQRERAPKPPIVPEATDSSENEATATTAPHKSAADTSLSPELHVPTVRSRNADSDQRPAPITSASSSTQQQRARRPSSEHRSREISDPFQLSAASGSVRPRRQSSGSRRDGEGSEDQGPSSSQVYPPVTERRRRRRRSSRSSSGRRM
jgi:hypothetical protein